MENFELLERGRSSAYRIMRSADGKRALPRDLAQHAADVIARHWLKAGRMSIGDDRLLVTADARAQAKWVAKRLEWMTNPGRHHGQQAAEYAEKTIRALCKGSISADQLYARCEEFGRLRKRHIDRNSAKRPRAEARSLRLKRFNITARWITSEAQIDEAGQLMANCLANKDFTKEYQVAPTEGGNPADHPGGRRWQARGAAEHRYPRWQRGTGKGSEQRAAHPLPRSDYCRLGTPWCRCRRMR